MNYRSKWDFAHPTRTLITAALFGRWRQNMLPIGISALTLFWYHFAKAQSLNGFGLPQQPSGVRMPKLPSDHRAPTSDNDYLSASLADPKLSSLRNWAEQLSHVRFGLSEQDVENLNAASPIIPNQPKMNRLAIGQSILSVGDVTTSPDHYEIMFSFVHVSSIDRLYQMNFIRDWQDPSMCEEFKREPRNRALRSGFVEQIVDTKAEAEAYLARLKEQTESATAPPGWHEKKVEFAQKRVDNARNVEEQRFWVRRGEKRFLPTLDVNVFLGRPDGGCGVNLSINFLGH